MFLELFACCIVMPTRLSTLLRRRKKSNPGSGGSRRQARSLSLSELDGGGGVSFGRRSPSIIAADALRRDRLCELELTREVKMLAGNIGIERAGDLEERWKQYYVLCEGKTEKVRCNCCMHVRVS